MTNNGLRLTVCRVGDLSSYRNCLELSAQTSSGYSPALERGLCDDQNPLNSHA